MQNFTIYDVVQRYEPEFYAFVKYLINNYTDQNFKRWKRKLNISICVYVYILTFIIDFSNWAIRQIIVEYMLCYFLIELYEKYITTILVACFWNLFWSMHHFNGNSWAIFQGYGRNG